MDLIGLKRTLTVFFYVALLLLPFNQSASAAANSDLNGKYIAVTQQTNNWGSRVLETFDGKGGGSAQTLEASNDFLNNVSFTYNVSSDDTYTLTPSGWVTGNGIISPDGKIVSLIFFDDDLSQLVVAIKKSSGMSNTKFKGEYIVVDQNTKGDGVRLLINLNGKGGGTFQGLEGLDGEAASGSITYSVSSDGSLTFTVPGAFTGKGIISPDGKIGTIFINGDGFSEIAIMIQKSTGMSNADLNGDFIFVAQNTDDEGIRMLATCDGNGGGTYQHLENSYGSLDSGTFTYKVSSDGTYTLTPSGWLTGNGIVSSDGNIATLIFFDDDSSEISVGIKKSAGGDPDNDGDGYTESQDCDDTNNTIYPGAIEICDDGIDQNCDGYDETSIDGPTAPRGLAANAVSYRKIMLRWTDQSTDEDGFKIERKKKFCSDDTYNWSQIATVSGDNKYEDVDDFDLDIKYSYRVRAYKGLGNSGYSNCGVTTTASATGTPSAPVNLVATNVSSSKVDLTWDEWSTNVTGFKIYRKLDNSGSWTLLATKGPTTFNYRDTKASGNQSTTGYCYYVQACNDKGCSPPTYTVCMPFNPTGVTAIAGSNGKIILEWEDNSDNERGFEIYRKTGNCSSSASWEKIKSAGINRTTVSDKKDLISGTNYAYKIRAYCRSWGLPYVYGYSDWSNCVSINAP